MAVSERHTVGLELDDANLTTEAASAKESLRQLQNQYYSCNEAIRDQEKAIRDLKAVEVPQLEVIKQHQDAIKKLKDQRVKLRQEFGNLGGDTGDLGKRANAPAPSNSTKKLADELKRIGGPLGAHIDRLGQWSELSKSVTRLLKTQAAQTFLMKAGVAAAAVAVGTLTKRLYDTSEAFGDLRMQERLHMEGIATLGGKWRDQAVQAAGVAKVLTSLGDGFRDAREQGRNLQAIVDLVSARSATGRDKITDYAKALVDAGIRGKEFQQVLQAAADVASVQGDDAGKAFVDLAKKISDANGDVDKLAKGFRAAFGGEAARQLLASDVQAQKLEESIAGIFGAVDTERLDDAKKRFNDVFSAGSNTGVQLRRIWKHTTQGLIDLGADWYNGFAEITEKIILSATHLGQDLTIFGLKSKLVFYRDFVRPWEEAAQAFRGFGKDVVQGFTDGIKALKESPVKAIKEMGTATIDALKSILGIHSPSKEFMKLGIQTGQGFVDGLDAQQSEAKRAIKGLVSTPVANANSSRVDVVAEGVSTTPAAAGHITVHIDSITIVVQDSSNPKATAEAVYDNFMEKLQVAARQAGAA